MQLLGNKVLLAMVKTPGIYESESLTLMVPSIAREIMNMGVVAAISEEAGKLTQAKIHDVVLVAPHRGRVLDKGGIRQMGIDEKRHWMIYEAEDVLATVDTELE